MAVGFGAQEADRLAVEHAALPALLGEDVGGGGGGGEEEDGHEGEGEDHGGAEARHSQMYGREYERERNDD